MKKSKIILFVLVLSMLLGAVETWAADPFNKEEKEFEHSSDKDSESSGCSSCS